MRWVRPLSARLAEPAETVGAKARGLVALHRLGLPVPPGFVVTTDACRAFLREGRLPEGLRAELAAAADGLAAATGRRFGAAERPLAVSVRSGASVSMPGMMDTVLNLGLTAEAAAGLAAETGDTRFALESRLRFLMSLSAALTGAAPAIDAADAPHAGAAGGPGAECDRPARAIAAAEAELERRCGRAVLHDAAMQLELAVQAVFSSWESARARTYRELHGIPHDLGTAVVVQAMVFGNRDGRSGTGVAFSRDPTTGEDTPYGDVLFGRQGEDVVSGRVPTPPLRALRAREPAVWAALTGALARVEGHYRDACYLEFTFESGRLWLLQARPGRLTGAAAVRVAAELADAGVITREEALLRVAPGQLRHARTPRIAAPARADAFVRGVGACPGVAAGRVATTAEAAVRMAAEGPVILVRPETSPHDMRGLAAAAGIVTARGGTASHAAVVARSLGRPAVVGAAGLAVDPAGAAVRAGGRALAEGALVTIDGTGGEVVAGSPPVTAGTADAHLDRLLSWADEVSGDHSARAEARRLADAHAVLRGGGAG
ncbi:pyruvate, phosphate dikinase [Streptomonospora nanhaiensis]|uniref:pyruvate, phosphate dikinase n=1 Tax=Streptomonospora nanhaiensis TaxID=1323731 RepID=UPI001C393558|nr:pyruvate, phosphate dikinase [Streptomonospora nanhaiensis]MBV2363319.1 pyruvate, phosphate dikinase [Streptomonospora nanhaiensis]MBX9391456.1 pyruvate, phosphate dikinase [Streptomonospora nanhaiensis]